jgi:hypothetical protein
VVGHFIDECLDQGDQALARVGRSGGELQPLEAGVHRPHEQQRHQKGES